MKKGGSFGLVLLVVVMAIVLLLAAKNWQAAAPRLSEAMRVRPEAARNATAADAPDPGDVGSSSRALPDVGDMRRATDRHADQVQEALAEAR